MVRAGHVTQFNGRARSFIPPSPLSDLGNVYDISHVCHARRGDGDGDEEDVRTEEQWVRICSQRPMTQILMKVGVWGPKDIWESHA